MDSREFLNKIRKMQESGQSIKLTEMKDIDTNSDDKRTKLMENIYKFPIITEDNIKEVEQTRVMKFDLKNSGDIKSLQQMFDKGVDSKKITVGTDGTIQISESKRLFENEELTGLTDTEEEEGQDISPDEQREEENAFKGKVSQLVEFQKIKVFTKTVTWSGRLVREGINWTYTLDDKIGCFISTNDDDTLQLTDDMLTVIKDIRAYYDIWSDEWSSRLTGGPSGGGEEEMGGGF